MLRMIGGLIVAALILVPSTGFAVEASYDCVTAGESYIGWHPRERQYTAKAATKVAQPMIVKLSDMNTDKPFLTGQGVTPLHRLSGEGQTTWFAELAPAGTVILWTFFNVRQGMGPPTAVLVSTKTYDFLGPQSYTALYACTPTSPGRRQ